MPSPCTCERQAADIIDDKVLFIESAIFRQGHIPTLVPLDGWLRPKDYRAVNRNSRSEAVISVCRCAGRCTPRRADGSELNFHGVAADTSSCHSPSAPGARDGARVSYTAH